MSAVGDMAMPVNFRYRDVFLKGRPQHDRYDPFRIRHPRMDRRKRAKIFAPFDALKGFSEAIAATGQMAGGDRNDSDRRDEDPAGRCDENGRA